MAGFGCSNFGIVRSREPVKSRFYRKTALLDPKSANPDPNKRHRRCSNTTEAVITQLNGVVSRINRAKILCSK